MESLTYSNISDANLEAPVIEALYCRKCGPYRILALPTRKSDCFGDEFLVASSCNLIYYNQTVKIKFQFIIENAWQAADRIQDWNSSGEGPIISIAQRDQIQDFCNNGSVKLMFCP
jgi:hypothetical protein